MTEQIAKTRQEHEFLIEMKGLALETKVNQVETAIWMTISYFLNNENLNPSVVLVALLNVVKHFVLAAPAKATATCLGLVKSAVIGLSNELEKRWEE